jgi:predicted nucleic acid-binding protein
VILVDTSIWIDHFRSTNPILRSRLNDQRVLIHPFVMGELALGRFPGRDSILSDLDALPWSALASDPEVVRLIDREALSGSRIGYIDAHLLAAVRLTSGATLWSRDKRLHAVASWLNLAAATSNP